MRKLLFIIALLVSCNAFAGEQVIEKLPPNFKINLYPKYMGMLSNYEPSFPLPKFKESFFSYSILQQVNEYVNSKIKYKNDVPGNDYWQAPNETVNLGTGDCEDYAILKKYILLNNGYTEDQLIILVGGYMTKSGENIEHSILMVKEKDGSLKYLDNEDRWVEDHLPMTVVYGINNLGVYR